MSFVSFKKHPVPKLNRYITVRDQYVGFHAYKDAAPNVAFLKNLHRHIFKWEAMIEVFHDDRELEFFTVKDNINQHVAPFISHSLDMGSCEMQAEKILEGLVNSYGPDRFYRVTVSEDGESDGIVEYCPEEQEPTTYGHA